MSAAGMAAAGMAAAGRVERSRSHGPRHVGPRPGTGLTEDQMAEAVALKRGGLSYRKIGEVLGCTAATVEYNLTIRQRRYAKPQIRLVDADRGERHPIDAAIVALGGRAAVGQRRATLDGRPASLVQIVEAANAALAAAGQPAIVYPGLRGGAPAMSAGHLGPAAARWARKLLAAGRDPVAVAVKLQVPYQQVAALVAPKDDGSETPAAVPASVAPSPEQGAGAGDRPMRAARPTPSRAKPEEAVGGGEAPATADDAGSRASGGAGAAALIQCSPDRCRIAEGDADGNTLDRSEPSALRAGHRGRTSTPPEAGRKASARANEGADPRSVTAGRDRHPSPTVVAFPLPARALADPAELFAGTRIAAAFGPGPGVGLGDLAGRECRWPLWPHGARPDFRCCGAPLAEGSRYCAAHARQSRGAAIGALDGLGKWASSA